MMKKTLLIIFLTFYAQLFSTTYYVSTTGNDANDGLTANTAWKTIYKACNSVPANGGHIISLGAGTFSETQTSNIPSGVTILGAGRNTTIITSSVYPIFAIPNGKNIVMHSFTLDGRMKALWQAMKIDAIQGFDFYDFNVKEFGYWTNVEPYVYISTFAFKTGSDIKIHDFEGTNASSGHNAMIGLGSGAMTNVEIYNGVVNNSEQSHGKIVGAGGASTPLNNVKIHDNTFYTSSVGGWAIPGTQNYPPQIVIEFWDGIMNGCEIYNNNFNACVSIQSNGHAYPSDTYKTLRIHHNKWNCDRNVGYQYAIETSNDNNEIDHNYIYGGAYSIASFGEWGSKPLKNVNIHHNVFEAQSISTLIVNMTGNVQNIRFANNNVYATSGNGLISFGGSVTSSNIVNNIFYKAGGASDNLNSSATISNNLFFNMTAKGSASISANPNFVASGAKPGPYFTLSAASPAIDKGVQIAGVTDGFLGAAPDLGAFEFGATPWTVGNGASVSGPSSFPIPSTVEAELAVLTGGTGVNTDHIGYSGAGFVDGYQASGAKTTFNLTAAAASDFTVKLNYANGSTTSTTLSLYLNGLKVKQIALASTGTWDAWSARTDTLSMKTGLNTLEYVFDATDGGHANLDKIEVVKVVSAYPIPSTIEAEAAELSGTAKINTDHLNFSGTGFVDGYNIAGPSTLFRVKAASTGIYSFELYYANALSTSSLSIYVNGVKLKQTLLPVLATWDSWSTSTELIDLIAGINTIEYVYDATDGGNVNLDKVVVKNATATGTQDAEALNKVIVYPNPSSTGFYLSGSIASISRLRIFTAVGTEVLATKNVSETIGDELKAGMYLVHVEYANGTSEVIKIIKE
jgi:hypothetical protein